MVNALNLKGFKKRWKIGIFLCEEGDWGISAESVVVLELKTPVK